MNSEKLVRDLLQLKKDLYDANRNLYTQHEEVSISTAKLLILKSIEEVEEVLEDLGMPFEYLKRDHR